MIGTFGTSTSESMPRTVIGSKGVGRHTGGRANVPVGMVKAIFGAATDQATFPSDVNPPPTGDALAVPIRGIPRAPWEWTDPLSIDQLWVAAAAIALTDKVTIVTAMDTQRLEGPTGQRKEA